MGKQRVKRRSQAHHGVKLVQLADGRRVARWTDPLSGKQQQQSTDKLGLTTDEARVQWARTKSKTLASLRAAVASGTVEARRETVAAAIKTYLIRFGHRPTRMNKTPDLDRLAEWLGNNAVADMADLSPLKMMRYRDHVLAPAADGMQESTLNKRFATTRAFLRWAIDQGMAPLLTMDSVRASTKRTPQPRHEIHYLKPDEIKALVGAMVRVDAEGDYRRTPMAPFCMALLLSGMRFAECWKLPWAAVDLTAGTIRLSARATKTGAARTITLAETPALLDLLRVLAMRRGANELVFPCRKHSLVTALAEAIKYGAPKCSPHVLRRTAGTILTCSPGVYGGASAYLSAKRLGHAVAVAEKLYAGHLPGLPPMARTFEAAAGIEAECNAIVQAAGGGIGGVATITTTATATG